LKVFIWATVLLALLVLGLDAYLLYGFYREDPAIPEAKAVKVTSQVSKPDGGAAGRDAAEYLDRVGSIQARSVEVFLDSNEKLLRYDTLSADDVEELEANYVALRDYRRRTDELAPPEKYEAQYESFDFALGDLHYAAELAYRMAANPLTASQSDFSAYALHTNRAAEHLRRSNEILGREFDTIEGVPSPTVR
jgi:hypothetical protein